MKKRIVLSLVFAALCALALVGCSSGGTKDLTGTWLSEKTNGTYMKANISSDSIEIFWMNDEDSMESLFWSGTFSNPEKETTEYSWTSQRNSEKMDRAIFSSSETSKDFTFKDGTISFQASAMGVSKTVELKKQ